MTAPPTGIPVPPSVLLDQPPLAPSELIHLEQLGGEVLATGNDIVVLQAEAILALEAAARSVGAPGRRALNVVTGPYGAVFGGWMREMGTDVRDVASAFDEVATVDAVTAAIAEHRPEVVALVHAEAATGGTNPVPEILAAARAVGALTILDAVASIGAEPVPIDEWGVDIAVIGGQKALAGPAGVSLVAVSDAAWQLIDATPSAPRGSSLSLLDPRDGWLRTDRTLIPGLPSWLESRALVLALERVQREGLDAVIDRHRRAAAAIVAGAEELGLAPWQRGAPASRAPVVTTLRLPDDPATRAPFREGALGAILSPGNGALRGSLLRVNHTGSAACLPAVTDALERLAAAQHADPRDAVAAAAGAWHTASGASASGVSAARP